LILTLAEENKNNLKYIEKVAMGLIEEKILTSVKYEEKMRQVRENIEFENKITALFRAENIKLKPKEKNTIKSWREFDFPDDMLVEGYNRCMKQIEKLSFGYINTIYINWNQKGFRTLEDAVNEFGNYPEGLENAGKKKTPEIDIEKFLENKIRKTLEF